MIEVMNVRHPHGPSKGLPYKRIATMHAPRNALMAPITVIMSHVNWLIGGIVVVESVDGYPGLAMYLLDSSLFKDVNAIMAGVLFMVMLAVATQWIADIIYTFLNPRIRYSQGAVAMTTTQTPGGQRSPSRPNLLQRLWGGLSVIFRSRIATIGPGDRGLRILVAVFAPLIAPHNPLAQDSKAINQGPSATYPLGTDKLGRDVMSRLVFGARAILYPGAHLGVFCPCWWARRWGFSALISAARRMRR